jgi:aspartate/methionine/tyrosine aminotransferase
MLYTALLSPSDHVVVLRPNYALNLDAAKAVRCPAAYVDLDAKSEFSFTIQQIEAALTDKTKLISVTTPHNPTGAVIAEPLLRALAALALSRQIWLLVDETYRDLSFDPPPPLAASFNPRVISVSSLSTPPPTLLNSEAKPTAFPASASGG